MANTVRQLPNIDFTADKTEIVDLPLDNMIKHLEFRLTLTEDVTATATSVDAQNPTTIIKEMQVIANGSIPIKRIEPAQLWEENRFYWGAPRRRTQVATAVATYLAVAEFTLFFDMPRFANPALTRMDARRGGNLTSLKLHVVWGNEANIVVGGTTALTLTKLEITSHEEVTDEQFDPDDEIAQFSFKEDIITVDIGASNTNFQFTDLPFGSQIYRGIFIRTDDADVLQDDIINKFFLKSNGVFSHQDGIVWEMLRGRNLAVYSLEALTSGIAWLDFSEFFLEEDLLNTIGLSSFDLSADITKGAGITTIKLYPKTMLPLV